MLAPEPCRSARRPSGQDSTGPSFGLTAPARSHRSDAFPQRTSPSDSPLRCKLSCSGRFSPLPSAPSPEVSLQNSPLGRGALPTLGRTCSTQAGQAPKLRAFGGKEYTPSPVFSTCHSEASSPLDRKRQRPRSRGPAGPGGGWSSESTKAAAAVKLPAGADYNSQMALRQPTRLPPQSPIPPPATPSALAFAWASASERGEARVDESLPPVA